MTRILVTDDHAIVRKGLKDTVEEIPGVRVHAEAANGDQTLKHLAKEKFDLVIMDICLPGRNGLDILSEIKRGWPQVAVLIYTTYPEAELAARAFKAGAAGYLTKEMPLSDLVKAVKKVIAGGRYMHAATGEKLAGYLAIANASLHGGLSERELQVMKFIAEGRSLKEIAHELSLSAKTISTYRTRILEKLHLRSNAELTRYVLERRVIA